MLSSSSLFPSLSHESYRKINNQVISNYCNVTCSVRIAQQAKLTTNARKLMTWCWMLRALWICLMSIAEQNIFYPFLLIEHTRAHSNKFVSHTYTHAYGARVLLRLEARCRWTNITRDSLNLHNCCVTNTSKQLPSFAFAEWQFFFLFFLFLFCVFGILLNVCLQCGEYKAQKKSCDSIFITQAWNLPSIHNPHTQLPKVEEKEREKLIGHWSRIWFQWFVDIACDFISLSPSLARSPFLSHFSGFLLLLNVKLHASSGKWYVVVTQLRLLLIVNSTYAKTAANTPISDNKPLRGPRDRQPRVIYSHSYPSHPHFLSPITKVHQSQIA